MTKALLLAGTVTLCALAGAAKASVFNTVTDTPLSAVPTAVSLGGPGNTFQFTAAATPSGAPGTAVATAGTGLVTSFLGKVADFGAGSTIGAMGGMYSFSAFTSAALIPLSATDDFIGLAFTLADGTHYGFAEVAGAELVSVAYETTPGTSITTFSSTSPTIPVPTAVPEPASMALLGVGALGTLAAARRWRRGVGAA